MDSGATERREVRFRGRVQGVGFRWTACRIASRFEVAGYVKNLADGRVLLVAEGEPEELGRFVSAVEAEMGRHIREASVAQAAATGEFRSFGIEY